MPENPTVPTPENGDNTQATPAANPAAPVAQPATPQTPAPAEPANAVASAPEVAQPAPAETPAVTPEVNAAPATPASPQEEVPVTEEVHRKPATQILIGLIAVIFGLIAVVYVFILWSLVEGNFSDPQFAQFLDMVGMQPKELKEKFTLVTHALFGGFSFIFLITTLVKFFQWVMTSSSSIYKKTHAKKMGVFLGILIFLIGIWMGVIWVINQADAAPLVPQDSTESLITTQPSPTVGLTAPISVQFDIGAKLYEKIPQDLVREILWDFDGNEDFADAAGPVVTHRFLDKGFNNGRYPVKVKIVYFSPSLNKEDERIQEHEVIISNVAASAVMTATPETGSVPLTVKFSAEKSTDVDGAIIQYEWDLDGDGEFEIRGVDEKETEKVFYKIGDHLVRLRVTGQNHDFAIAEKTISVVAAEEKIRAEIVSPDSSFTGMAPLSVTFDGAQSYTRTGRIVRYEWRVDGGDKSYVGRKMQRVFDTPGEYEVELLIENEAGDKDTITQTVVVENFREMKILTTPLPNETGAVIGKTPLEVSFDASESQIPNAVEWHWDFEADGETDEFSETTTHVFRDPGTYKVKLTIIDADENEFVQYQKVVVEKIGVLARISANPSSGSVPLTVEFDGSGSQTSEGEIIDYIWTFPEEEPIHYNGKIAREFRQVGVFPVKLEILTSSGKRAETEMFVSVRGKVLQSSFETNPMAGVVPLTVRFSPKLSTGNIKAYYWTFGDGGVSTDAYPEHTYTYEGEFPVTLKLTDDRGLVSESTKYVKVTGEPKK
jgi:PKD repeat protein